METSSALQPHPTELVAADLADPESEAIAGWLLSKRSANTRKAYGRDICQYLDWLAVIGESLATANASTVELWSTWQLEEQQAATASVARRCAAVSSFYQWAAKPGRLLEGQANPASPELVDRVKASSVHTPALTLTEAQQLLVAAKASKRYGARDHILVLVLLSTGMRVAELMAADIEHLRNDAGTVMLTVEGKGRATRAVAIDPTVHHLITDDGRHTGPLVLNNQSQRLDQWDVTRILARLARAAGIETSVTPHVLRATYITIGDELGARLEDLQANVGHSDPRRTQAYIRRHRSAQQQGALAAQVVAAVDQ